MSEEGKKKRKNDQLVSFASGLYMYLHINLYHLNNNIHKRALLACAARLADTVSAGGACGHH